MLGKSASQKRISVFQLYAVFFVCRATALFTFIAPQKTPFSPGDRILMAIPFFIIEALFTIPIFLVTKNGETLLTRAESISPSLLKIIGAVYSVAFAWSAAVSLARFEIFVSTVMFPGSLLFPFAASTVILCIYTARKGIEAIGRSSVVVTGVMLVSIFAILISVLPDFDILNLTPPLLDGITPLLSNGFSAAARTTETGLLLFILPSVKGNAKKGIYFWLGGFALLASILLGAVAGVTGKYGDSQMFQLYTLTVLAKLGIFEKADAVISGLWVLCSFFKCAFYILISADTANKSLFKHDKDLTFIASGASVFVFYLLLSGSVGSFAKYLSSEINKILYAVFIGIVPLTVFAASQITERKRKERQIL